MNKPDMPSGPDPADRELIDAAVAGASDAFGKLVQKYQTALFDMILRHLGHREEAEDVLQQVLLKAYQHLKDFRGESKFYTWLYTIALNHTRNHIRQKSTRRTTSLDYHPEGDDRAPQWPDKGPTPEETVAQKTEIQALQEAMENLSAEQKSIFTLYYFQHMSLEEVAQRLEKPLGTVKVYLHRARKTVCKILENPMGLPMRTQADEAPRQEVEIST